MESELSPHALIQMTLTAFFKHYYSIKPILKYSDICRIINIDHGVDCKFKYTF